LQSILDRLDPEELLDYEDVEALETTYGGLNKQLEPKIISNVERTIISKLPKNQTSQMKGNDALDHTADYSDYSNIDLSDADDYDNDNYYKSIDRKFRKSIHESIQKRIDRLDTKKVITSEDTKIIKDYFNNKPSTSKRIEETIKKLILCNVIMSKHPDNNII
jgi:hypothetical protein